MHRSTQIPFHLDIMSLLRLPQSAVTTFCELSICQPHGLSRFLKEVKIMVNDDVALQCHAQVELHVQIIKML